MTDYDKGDLILVPFPFTDLSTTKRRPGLVISPRELNASGDVTIAFVTSQVDTAARTGDCMIRDWREAGLPKPSLVRMKVVTLSSALIIRKIGSLPAHDRQAVFKAVRAVFG